MKQLTQGDARGETRIGTSGIVVPGAKTTFPDEYKKGSRLHYYGSLFNTLEVNSSFYKIPLAKTFEKWATEVPENFTFTIKCWRGITHARHLEFSEKDIDTFMVAIEKTGSKSGCILIQFPRSITLGYLKKVESILEKINQKNFHQQWQLAIELRHSSWYCDAAYEVFQRYNTTIVFHDMPGSATPLECPVTDVIYYRFHGPVGDYSGSYDREIIQSYAEQIIFWREKGKNIYIYFNNTIGSALENAQLLKSLLCF